MSRSDLVVSPGAGDGKILPGRPVRLAVVCDPPEEGWASMDLVGEMVTRYLADRRAGGVEPQRVCPAYRGRLSRLPVVGRVGPARNADRLVHRFVDAPRAVRRLARAGGFDLYHVVDHSYSQLVHALPAGRTVVTCHDLDTFRCLLGPEPEPRPAWFRAMTRRILSGLRRAAALVCDSEATRDAVVAHGIATPDRLHVVYLGTHPECAPDPDPAADAEAARLLGPSDPGAPPDLLHVGSNIPRKRVDVLLDVFASVRRAWPGARLIKVGGALPPHLADRARALGVADAVVTLGSPSPLSTATLAAVYRRAALVLQPSEAEGFGLPAVEALACGVPLLASDIPVLREVGGDAPVYRAVGDVAAWAEAATDLIRHRREVSHEWLARRESGLARARLYSWAGHADRLTEVYREVLSRAGGVACRKGAGL